MLYVGLSAVIVLALLGLGLPAYMAWSGTRVERVPVEEDPKALGLDYEDVSFPSRGDEIILRGWYLPTSQSRRCIIIIHGIEKHRADPTIGILPLAKSLVEHGYNVLLFDLRGHGESGGNRLSMGYYERLDVLGAVDYLRSRGFQEQSIGLLGFSLGAAAAILAAAQEPDIPVVADSSFADVTELMRRELPKHRLPGFFFYPMAFMLKLMYGIDLGAIRPLDAVGHLSRPILFIHGEADSTVPPDHSQRLFQASHNPNAQLWIVPGAEHVQAYHTHPEEYVARICAFFDQALR